MKISILDRFTKCLGFYDFQNAAATGMYFWANFDICSNFDFFIYLNLVICSKTNLCRGMLDLG